MNVTSLDSESKGEEMLLRMATLKITLLFKKAALNYVSFFIIISVLKCSNLFLRLN